MLKLLDRYILRQVIVTFIFVLVALCVIFIIVNSMDQMDKFMDNNVGISIIVLYYLNFLPDILRILVPISLLISVLLVIGKLSNNNEITALKSGGGSLYRMIFPFIILGILLSLGQYYFNGWIVPRSNAEKERISQVYLKKGGINSILNLYFRDNAFCNVGMRYYDPVTDIGHNVSIDYFDSAYTDKSVLICRIEAKNIKWNDSLKEWMLHNLVKRNFIDSSHISTFLLDSERVILNINNKQIARINKKPDEMNFTEMADYISILSNGGKDVRQMQNEYYSSQALPLANLIVILFGVPFASVKRRGGMAVQIAAAMVIVAFYLIFFMIIKPLGLALNLPPILVGWLANILFLFAGVITIIKTQK